MHSSLHGAIIDIDRGCLERRDSVRAGAGAARENPGPDLVLDGRDCGTTKGWRGQDHRAIPMESDP